MSEDVKITHAVTVEHAVEVLQRAFEADPDAMNELFGKRVDCNEALASDASIQVLGKPGREGGTTSYTVGVIGILNGIFGADEEGWGAIAAKYQTKCGCEKVPNGADFGTICLMCGQKVILGKLYGFADNGRKVEPV